MIIKHSDCKATFIFDQESKNHVYLAGDFNNWDYKKTPLKYKENKWQVTLKLKPGAYQFKYVTYDNEENWYNDWRADAYIKSPLGCDNSVVIFE